MSRAVDGLGHDWFTSFHSLARTVRLGPCRLGLPDAVLFCLVDVCAQPGQEKTIIGCLHLLELIPFFSLHARPCTLTAHRAGLACGIRSIPAYLQSLAPGHSLHVESLALQLRQPNKDLFSYAEGLAEGRCGQPIRPLVVRSFERIHHSVNADLTLFCLYVCLNCIKIHLTFLHLLVNRSFRAGVTDKLACSKRGLQFPAACFTCTLQDRTDSFMRKGK